MKMMDTMALLFSAVMSGGKHTDQVQEVRQSSQIRRSAAIIAEGAAKELGAFSSAAQHMREMR